MRRKLPSSVAPGGTYPRLVLILLAVSAVGCETIQDLRAALHGETGGEDSIGNARLRVEVEPPDGITILLDGVRVASMSPYVNEHAQPGAHILEVRAMGYHSLRLPIQLEDDETLIVPLALRPRPEGPTFTPRQRPAPEVQRTPAPPPPSAPKTQAPDLPPGVKPIELHVMVRPSTDIFLDGVRVQGRTVTFRKVRGQLGFGDVELSFRIASAGLLFFILPNDGAKWEVGGRPTRPGSEFKHNRGVMLIKRTAPTGTTLTVLLKR